MMRVGMSINFAYFRNGRHKMMDGIGVYTHNLFKKLSISKEVSLIPTFFNSPHQLSLCKQRKFHEEPHVCWNPILPFNVHKSLETKVDVFHATDFMVPKLKNTPVISTIYDAAMFTATDIVNPRFRKTKNYFLKKHARYADHIVTISHSVVDDIVKYWNVDPKKISVIYCGISEDWFIRLSEKLIRQVLKEYQIDRPFLLSVGTIQGKKNYTRLLDAYMQMPKEIRRSVDLVIVGKRGSSSLTEIEKIQRLHDKKYIKWLKHIPLENLRALYQSSLALVFPSLNEGFGLPILEGFASQTPVITSSLGAMEEVASDAAIFIDPHDVDSIRYGMEEIITEKHLRANLVKKGLMRVSDFSWQTCAKELIQIYRLFS